MTDPIAELLAFIAAGENPPLTWAVRWSGPQGDDALRTAFARVDRDIRMPTRLG